jgi:hypothetical protein
MVLTQPQAGTRVVPHLISLAAGAVAWIVISAASGNPEAWDSNWYWTVGVPCMFVSTFGLGLLWRAGAWRWGIEIVLPQLVLCFLGSGSGPLVGVGFVFFGMLAGVSCLLAQCGSWISYRIWPIPGEGCCQECGYDLTGLLERRCPECGESFSPEGNTVGMGTNMTGRRPPSTTARNTRSSSSGSRGRSRPGSWGRR